MTKDKVRYILKKENKKVKGSIEMIRLYTSKKQFKQEGITHIDAYFNTNIVRTELGEREEKLIQRYEKAEFIDKKEALLKGRFGMYTLENISSGVKTLVVLSMIERGVLKKPSYVNITECGKNILEPVFTLAKKLDVPLILNHTELYGCSDFDFIVNDKYKVGDIVGLVDLLNNIKGSEQ